MYKILNNEQMMERISQLITCYLLISSKLFPAVDVGREKVCNIEDQFVIILDIRHEGFLTPAQIAFG